jgi:dienelactone hydrolase
VTRAVLTLAVIVVLMPELKFGLTYRPLMYVGPNFSSGNTDEPLRDLDGHFPFTPAASKEAWDARAQALRRQVRVALGLWPWPTRTPLNAVVHGPVRRDGYTIERVFFESVPGHFVTGSLYRPQSSGAHTRRPAVLSPHGHWPGGRFQDVAEPERRKQLASGAERFDNAARHVLQARAVQLARMGTVVFLFDMIGYADSVQIPQAIAHSARGRERRDSEGLFFSTGAELRLQSVLGLQMWNAVRALDFLTSLPDVDPARIAVTGASGGGTQTFLLGAIDDRPAVAFPAVMVSTRMQGGCTCENADYLRIGTGNVELAALFAPKPLGMTAADDWTRTMPTDGFPQLQAHYALFGAKDRVALFPFLQFGHNYNHVSRAGMYGFLSRHLSLGFNEPVLESDFVPLSREEATVWTSEYPAPPGGETHERAVTTWWQADTDTQLAAPRDVTAVNAWRVVVVGAMTAIVNAGPAPTHDATLWSRSVPTRGVTVVTASASSSDLSSGAEAGPFAAALLDAGQQVIAVEESTPAGNVLVANRHAAAYTFGYNPPLVVERARRVVAGLEAARTAAAGKPVTLVALDAQSAAWAALAAASAPDMVDRAAFVTDGFRFASVTSMENAAFLPGSVKYGDLPAMLGLLAPKPVWIAGETTRSLSVTAGIFRAAGAPRALTLSGAKGEQVRGDLMEWITDRRD